MSNPILIPRCILELHPLATDPDGDRHNLSCIYITRTEQAVTNGHQLVKLETELEDLDQQFDRVPSKSVSLPVSVVQAILKGSKKDTKGKGQGSIFQLEIISESNVKLTRINPDGSTITLQFDTCEYGKFPDYNQCMPTSKEKKFSRFWDDSNPQIGFNLELTQPVFEYLKRIKANTICGFKFIDDLSPILSTQEFDAEPWNVQDDESFALASKLTWLLMPCRVTP